MTTEEALEAITDSGAFEKLAAAVLRAADPTYTRLIHLGVNAQGKTIKAPVDGLVPPGSGQAIVATAYTTTAAKSLRRKWLSSSDADVPKAVKSLNSARAGSLTQRAVLVLASNRSPSFELVNDIGQHCQVAGVEFDLWERSRIAAFLDTNSDGQWLRQKFLGIKAERLSYELLLSLSEKSHDEYAKNVPNSSQLVSRRDEGLLVGRALTAGMTVLSGPSGFGKTALAVRVMNAWLQKRRPTLWIPENVLDDESSLTSAIRRVLRDLHGSELDGSVLQVAGSTPFLIVIDDISRARDSGRALEKVASWAPISQSSTKSHGLVHLFAPSWPDVILRLRQDIAKALGPCIVELSPLDLDEAARTYRSRSGDAKSTDDEVFHLVERLGRDPLLIDLHGPNHTNRAPEAVIQSWISGELARVSKQTGVPTQSYRTALLELGNGMLRDRTMAPLSNQVDSFFNGRTDSREALSRLIQRTDILRWDHMSGDDALAFRHDRIRDAILADAMSQLIGCESAKYILSDPHFSDVLGAAIVQRQFDGASLRAAATLSPLALFEALQKSGRAKAEANAQLVEAIENVMRQQRECQSLPDMFFWATAHVLERTDSIEVERLCSQFPTATFRIEEALVRNGRVDAAIGYMAHHELGLTYQTRDRLVRHASEKHPHFISDVASLLSKTDSHSRNRVALLLLAGFAGSRELQHAVEKCIKAAPPQNPAEVESAMWAVTQCCDDNLAQCLDVVFDCFSKLSDDRPDNAHLSEREYALLGLGGKRIARDLPKAAVPMIIAQYCKRPVIKDEINRFLHRVDYPEALQYWVRQRAVQIRADQKAGHSTWPYSFFNDEWSRKVSYGRLMSSESRLALSEIWNNPAEREEERQTAFGLWRTQVTVADTDLLRSVPALDKVGERILQTRVSLGDRNAFPEFLRRVDALDRKELSYWWQFARGVMNAELAIGLEKCISQHGDSVRGDPGWILSELIMELSPEPAESILIKHQDRLADVPRFFQAAVFVNTEATQQLASESFKRAPDHSEMLRFIVTHFGIEVSGRSQRVTRAHFDALLPYIDHMQDSDLMSLWYACNRRGWFDWRREHLDARALTIDDSRVKFDISSREALLDQLCTQKHVWPNWVEHHFVELGYSPEEAFSAITSWAQKRGTEAAIKVASDLFFHEANRTHLPLFDRLVSSLTGHEMLQQHVHFGVKYRTLL